MLSCDKEILFAKDAFSVNKMSDGRFFISVTDENEDQEIFYPIDEAFYPKLEEIMKISGSSSFATEF